MSDTSWYDFIDVDIMATVYSVHAIVKKKPELPPRALLLLGNESFSFERSSNS